jgi:hypothetical protein
MTDRPLGQAPAGYSNAMREAFDRMYEQQRAFGIAEQLADVTARNHAEGIDVVGSARRARETDPAPGDVIIRRADEMTVERIAWLWPGYLARRKLHIAAGDAGCNKTTLATALGATLSIGGRWPDGSRAPLGSTLFWSGEDGIEDTLLPRFIAHEADLTRIHFVSHAYDEKRCRRAFDPSRDMDELTRAALRLGDVALIVIDPVVLTVRGDSNSNADVRRGLAPVVQLAERMTAAALGITHFTKGTAGRNPVERVTGSLGFGAAARVVFAVGRIPEDQGGGRLLVRAKSNIGPDGGGFRFAVRPVEVAGGETIRLEWCDPVQGTARELLAHIERDPEQREADNDADTFLRETLLDAGGSMTRKEVLAAAKRAGYPERTIEHARARCRIVVRTSGFGKQRGSVWALPSITASLARTHLAGSNGSNGQDGDCITAISAKTEDCKVYARATAMDDAPPTDGDEYRKATRGE